MQPTRILNAYSGEAQRGSGLRFALRLADRCDATVFGVLRHDASYLESEIGSYLPDTLRANLRDLDRTRAAEIEARFAQITEEEGQVGRATFQDLRNTPGLRVADIAPFHDVVVVGRNSDALHEKHLSARADLIAVLSHRPVIVVPDAYDGTVAPKRLCLVWDGRPHGLQALRQALGVFGEAEVSIKLTVEPGTAYPGGGVEALLAARGKSVDITPIGSDRSTAAMLAEVAGAQAELIVMGIRGAFEHSGNFEDRLISQAKLPCLIAH